MPPPCPCGHHLSCERAAPEAAVAVWSRLPFPLQLNWWKTRSLLDGRAHPKEVAVLRFLGQRSQGMLPALEPFAEFRLTVQAFNSKGAGPESEPYTFQTPEGGEGSSGLSDRGVSRGWADSRGRVLREPTARIR